MKINLYDLMGVKSGMNFYLEAFTGVLEENDIEVEIWSNFSHNNKKKHLPNIFVKSPVLKIINLFICYWRLFLAVLRLKKNQYIIILMYGNVYDFPVFMIAKMSKRVVLDVHEIMPLDFKNPILRKANNYLYKTCPNKIIAHSDRIKDLIMQTSFKSGIKTVPLFPNYSDVNYDIKNIGEDVKRVIKDDGNIYFLFFGNVRPSKGIFDLLAAAELVKDKRIKIIIAGQDIFNNITDYQKRHPMAENILLIIRLINDDEMKYLFTKSDATLLPYDKISQSGVLQTAVSFKIPLLTSNIVYFSEIVETFPSFGRSVCTTDPQVFADSLVDFADELSKKQFYEQPDVEKYYNKDKYNAFATELKTWLPPK